MRVIRDRSIFLVTEISKGIRFGEDIRNSSTEDHCYAVGFV